MRTFALLLLAAACLSPHWLGVAATPPASGPAWNPEWREQYLAQAETNFQFSADLRAWLNRHPDIRAGLLVVQDLPNSDYAANLDTLLHALPAAQAERYAHLLLAISLQPRFVAAEGVQNAAESNSDVLAKKIAALMQERHLSLAQFIEQADSLTKERGLSLPKKRAALWEAVAYASGTYPPRRPLGAVEWTKLLIARYETALPPMTGKGKTTWPLFPLDKAPWPLLAPLKAALPQDEADFIWDRFTGKTGERKLQTYGRYTWDYEKPEVKYKVSAWNPSSLPRIIEDGGVCGRLSMLAQQSFVSLGQPAFGMYQPGHRALMTYEYSPATGRYSLRGWQGITGPGKSSAQWCLPQKPYTTSVVSPQGLVLAMNHGLDSWLDTCIALHTARKLTEPKAKADLLTASLARNPFNTDVWFELTNLGGTNLNALGELLAALDVRIAAGAKAETDDNAPELSANTDLSKVKRKARVAASPEREAANLAVLLRTLILRDICQQAVKKPSRHGEVLAFAQHELDRCAQAGHPYKDEKLDQLLLSLGAPAAASPKVRTGKS